MLDLDSRKNVDWVMVAAMPATPVCAALHMTIVKRNSATMMARLNTYLDHGARYATLRYQAVLAKNGLASGTSRKGNCWDSAVR